MSRLAALRRSFLERARATTLAGIRTGVRAARAHPRIAALLAVGGVLVAIAVVRDRDPWRAWANERAETRIVRLADDIREAAAEFGRDPYLIAGVVYAESSGRPWVKSSAGALGLMQLKLSTAVEQARRSGMPEPSRRDLLQPLTNLRLGTGYLDRMIERFDDDPRQGLMAYNTGPTRFAGWLAEAGGFEVWLAKTERERGPPKPGTVRHYAAKVLDAAQRFRAQRLLEPSD